MQNPYLIRTLLHQLALVLRRFMCLKIPYFQQIGASLHKLMSSGQLNLLCKVFRIHRRLIYRSLIHLDKSGHVLLGMPQGFLKFWMCMRGTKGSHTQLSIIMGYRRKQNWFLKMIKKIICYWRRLVASPAMNHESFKLELSGAQELTDSSRAWRFFPSTRSCSSVFG